VTPTDHDAREIARHLTRHYTHIDHEVIAERLDIVLNHDHPERQEAFDELREALLQRTPVSVNAPTRGLPGWKDEWVHGFIPDVQHGHQPACVIITADGVENETKALAWDQRRAGLDEPLT